MDDLIWPSVFPLMLHLNNRFGRCLYDHLASLEDKAPPLDVNSEALRIGRFYVVNTEQPTGNSIGHWGFWGFLE
jgi:hypothetical protein